MKPSFKKLSRPASVAGSVFIVFGALAASAQEMSKTSKASSSGSSEEVVALDKLEVSETQVAASVPMVASTRLALTPRETPQAISTIGRVRLDDESLFSVNDVLKNVTGVFVSFYDTQRPLYFARGFQITDFQVDGIPTYSGSTNQEYDTALYERIDVIRGANGLLSGAGIPSATVNMTRKRPGKEFAASVRGTVGSWDFYRSEADVNVPMTKDGRFRSRFVVAAQDAESFRDRYEETKFAWLASVEGDVTATTTLGAGYQYQDNDPASPMWGTLPRFASDGTELDLPVGTNYSTNWTQWDRTATTAFVTIDQKLGENWQIRAAFNRTEGEVFSLRVYQTRLASSTANTPGAFPNKSDGSGLRLLAGLGETEDVRDNIDIYATGKFELLGRQHDLVLGWNMNNLEADSPTYASVAGWEYIIPDYRTFNGDAPAPLVAKTGAKQIATTDQNGLYGTLRLRVLEPLSVILGARLSDWETQTDVYNTNGTFNRTQGAYKVSDEVTPYVGLVYDINNVWSAYASYTDVFRPQNAKDVDNNLLEPVLGTNIEGGLKAEFFAKRFAVTVSVFETKQDNYAVQLLGAGGAPVPIPGTPDFAYIAVDGTKSNGVEVEFSGFITTGWTANLGYSNINTKRNALDLTYANVPEHLVQFSTQYQFSGALKKLSVGAGVNWQGEQIGYGVSSPYGLTTVEQSAYALYNVFANYRITDHFTASLSVRNLTDYKYWATLDYPNYGEPRNITVSLRWNY